MPQEFSQICLSGAIRASISSQNGIARMPWPERMRATVYPVFLPFLGCPSRCAFCAQDIQTGARAAEKTLLDSLKTAMRDLSARRAQGKPACELAFYGGTFTALPERLWDACLEAAENASRLGLVSGCRCSTRPDAISAERVSQLASAGFSLVELGAQSFSVAPLSASGRTCGPADIIRACGLLQKAGMNFVIQLMPGIPGGTVQSFLADVRQGIALGATALRFYPCLVLKGTRLAQSWTSGLYTPWSLRKAIAACARGLLMAQAGGCPVIRMGVAQQAGLEQAILAGPAHPAFGGRVLGLALLLACFHLKRVAGLRRAVVVLPRNCQGCHLGWRGELKPLWANMGTVDFRWTDAHAIEARDVGQAMSSA